MLRHFGEGLIVGGVFGSSFTYLMLKTYIHKRYTLVPKKVTDF